MKLSALARTFRTVRHLRPAQVYWRLRYSRERKRPPVVPHVPGEICLSDDFPEVPLVLHDMQDGGRGESDLVDSMEQGRFEHFNAAKPLGRDPTDWMLGAAAENRLWTIALHYHEWAWQLAERVAGGGDDARRADECLRRLLNDWIDNCGLEAGGARELAWNSFAISTRIGWWCRLYHLLGSGGRKDWADLEQKFTRSLWRQAAYLEKHIEWDLRANHVLRDIVGLAWAGRFFDGPAAKRWLDVAERLAPKQAEEQVLADGGHFERSPMYHIHAMEDFLSLAVLLESPAAKAVMRETWRKMAEFLIWMRHPDGQVPLFNDGGFNGAGRPGDMISAGCRALGLQIDENPRRGGKLFSDFGLAVWHDDTWSVFFDVGRVGVDYQPGHAHADTLCVEASFEGDRVFVDPGTFGYDNNESRRYDRSTLAHNTVSVDGADSSEVWHIFRVGRRARPADVRFEAGDAFFLASGSHDGYARLSGSPVHKRELELSESRGLIITDHISGKGCHTVEGGLLLAPEWTAKESGDGWGMCSQSKQLRARIEFESAGDFQKEIKQRFYSPEYGRRFEVQRLSYRGRVNLPCVIRWRITPCSKPQ